MNGRMPTKEGDVIVQRLTSYYRVWIVMTEGAQEPDVNVAPFMAAGRQAAEEAAENRARETNGRIFRVDPDGSWSVEERQ